VKVSISGKTAEGKAAADGKWKVTLPPLAAGGPFTLKVEGPETVDLQNVMVGDVWLCSGQSNMEWQVVSSANAQAEIAAADFPKIRHIFIPHVTSGTPQPTVTTEGWKICSPQTAGGFTAVGYYFARHLHQELDGVPIGLIHSSWGGTIAEAWASKEGLTPLQDFNQTMEALEQQAKAAPGAASPQDAWYAKNDPEAATWSSADFADSAWPELPQPLQWMGSNVPALASFDGVAWFRRSFEVPAAAVGKETVVHLGAIDDDDTVWLNGKQIGATEGFMKHRSYAVPAGLLKAGRNTLAVRVLDHNGGGGLTGPADVMRVTVKDQPPIPLTGPWRYKVAADLSKVPPYPKPAGSNPNVPTVLYNAMIAPLVPYGIKGAIWYQGESNAARGSQYRKLLPAMIGDWRQRFGQGDFPFYIVQLANFQAQAPQPGESDWAELREAQALTAKNVKNSGQAVIIDIGEAGDIHPKNKQDVGKRLALQALAKTYGKKVVAAGPEFKEAKKEGAAMRVSFTSTGGGLVAKDGTLKSFAIAGEDRKWVWAEAKIDGDSVVLSSPQVPNPVAVRYAWAANPEATLFNKEGLPAGPFRTDDWPGVTDGRK
jgi:sialate O-acetylesterase